MKARLLSLLLLGGCATASISPPPLTIAKVWERHEQLNGQVIRVTGIIIRCGGLSCQLLESTATDARWLSFAAADAFDASVSPHLGRHLVVEARFDATCLRAHAERRHAPGADLALCTDRAPMLADPKLVFAAR